MTVSPSATGVSRPFARADVLAAHVHVHEARDLPVLEHTRAQRGEARDEIDEDIADGAALGRDHGLATGLGAERRRDAHGRHQAPLPAAQNST